MKPDRSRNFAVRLYCENKELIHMLAVNAHHYAYILHDKDIYKNDSEDHIAGDIKKAHFHMVLNFEQAKTITAVRELIKKYIPHAGEMVSFLKSAKGGFDYLTHDTEEAVKDLKYHYDRSLIITDDPKFWYTEEVQKQIKEDKEDWTLILLDRLIDEKPISRKEYIDLAHKYGRDYIFNFGKVLAYADYVKGVADNETNT